MTSVATPADRNSASSCSASLRDRLLALAEAFATSGEPLERGLVFLASSGHFHGGIGCREFVAQHRGGLLEKIVAAIGVEHIGEEAEGAGSGGYAKTGQAAPRALFVDKTLELLRVLEEEVQRVNPSRTLAVDAYLFGATNGTWPYRATSHRWPQADHCSLR